MNDTRSSMFPEPAPPRVLYTSSTCLRCQGAKHVAMHPADAGWIKQADGWWVVPKTDQGPRSVHRFTGPERLWRPCECAAT